MDAVAHPDVGEGDAGRLHPYVDLTEPGLGDGTFAALQAIGPAGADELDVAAAGADAGLILRTRLSRGRIRSTGLYCEEQERRRRSNGGWRSR